MGCTKGRHTGEAGENVAHKDCWGSDIRDLNLLVILRADIYSMG